MANLNELIQHAKNAVSQYISNAKPGGGGTTSYAPNNLTGADLDKARSIFSAELLVEYDKTYGNGDGELTTDEYQKAYSASMKEYYTTIGQMNLETADLNYDGKVDASDDVYKDMDFDGDIDEEDQKMHEDQANQAIEIDSNTSVNNIDANKDGVISVEEMALLVKMKDAQDSEGTQADFDGSFSVEAETYINSWLASGNYDLSTNTEDLKTDTKNAKAYLESEAATIADEPAATPEPRKVKVQKWGSKPEGDAKYANDSISRIVANHYPDVKLYSKEYNDLVKEIVSMNNLKNPNTIPTGSELLLP